MTDRPTRATKMEILRKGLREERGVSAIEFALIAPALLVLYVGAVEIGNALTIDRRVALVGSTAADLVAQKKTTSTAELKDVANAATSILTPYSTQPLKIVLTSVVADQNNKGKVAWSYGYNGGSARSKNSGYTVPDGLTQANSSVIVAEVTYDFAPLLNLSGLPNPGFFKMSTKFYARPRKSLTVAKSD
jgi:Flp pilus assembly protein TadG